MKYFYFYSSTEATVDLKTKAKQDGLRGHLMEYFIYHAHKFIKK